MANQSSRLRSATLHHEVAVVVPGLAVRVEQHEVVARHGQRLGDRAIMLTVLIIGGEASVLETSVAHLWVHRSCVVCRSRSAGTKIFLVPFRHAGTDRDAGGQCA